MIRCEWPQPRHQACKYSAVLKKEGWFTVNFRNINWGGGLGKIIKTGMDGCHMYSIIQEQWGRVYSNFRHTFVIWKSLLSTDGICNWFCLAQRSLIIKDCFLVPSQGYAGPGGPLISTAGHIQHRLIVVNSKWRAQFFWVVWRPGPRCPDAFQPGPLPRELLAAFQLKEKRCSVSRRMANSLTIALS